MIGACISFFNTLFSLQWVDALEMAYLFLIGTLLATVDSPIFSHFEIVSRIRLGVSRFCSLLTRVTCKGLVYIFMGCTLWSSMMANFKKDTGMNVLAVILGVVILFSGFVSLVLGVNKSHKLRLVKLELQKHENVQQMYTAHAKTKPELGLTSEEFNKMCPYLRGIQFEGSDLRYIFNAISSDPSRQFLSIHDMVSWVQGGLILV
jgi:hypothetical protein